MSTTLLKPQRGVGLIAAIFVVLVIAGLIVTLTRITARQSISTALDDRGVRAYWAARAGIEWGSYQITRGTNPSCAGWPGLPAGATSLSEYTVVVLCTGTGPYEIRATATAGTGSTYVERVITRVIN